MSSPGAQDFLATRAKGPGGSGVDFLNQLASGGGGGAQTVSPAASPAPAAGAAEGSAGAGGQQPSNLPMGLQFQNVLSAHMRAAQAEAAAIRDRKLPDAGSAFTGDIHAAWNALKSDFGTWYSETRQAPPDLTSLDGLKSQFMHDAHAGKVMWDSFQTLASPLAGAWDEATGAAAKGMAKVMPIANASQFKDMLDQASLGLGPEGGAASAAGKAGAAAEGADTLAAKATFKPAVAPEDAAAGAKLPPGGKVAGESADLSGEGLEPPKSDKPARIFDIAGENPGAEFKVTPALRAKAGDFLAGKGTSPIDVHLEALADPATRSEAVNQIAQIIPKDAVKGLDISEMGAYSLNLTPTELMTAIRPKFASDETFMAAAMAQNSAAEVFWNAARKATQTAAPEDVEAATRAYAYFNDFTGAFRDAKTDWGRGGRAQQVAMSAKDDFTKHIQSVVENVGADNVQDIIRKAADLDDPRKVSPFVASMRWMGGRQGMLYGWYNWLLSHAVIPKKLVSDASLAALNIGTRYAAEKFGPSGAVAPGETMALIKGYVGSMSDAIRAAGKGFRSGQSQFQGDYQSLFDGQLFDRGGQLAKATPDGIEATSTTPAALEYLRMALPTSAIAAADDFAKVSNYRAELHAMAFREASQRMAVRADASANGAKAGNLPDKTFAQHFDDIINNVQPDMHQQAVTAALRNTLQEPLEGVGLGLQDTLDKINIPIRGTSVEIPLGRILVPFTKISTNAMRMAYSSSPVPFALPSPAWKAKMAAGGAQRDLALAQAGLGTAVSMASILWYAAGKITGAGPSSPDMRAAWLRAGNKPYHIDLAGAVVPYGHVEPLATTLGVIADTGDLMRYANEEDNSQLAVSLALGTGNAMLDKTYLSTISQLMEAMEQPDQKGKRFAEGFLASLAVPGDVGLAQRMIDPWLRAHQGLVDLIKTRTPGFSETMPPVRSLWGAPIPRENDLVPMVSEGAKQAAGFEPGPQAEPIDKWIWAHRGAFPDSDIGRLGLTTPPRALTFDVGANDPVHVPLDVHQQDRLKVLAGNEAKSPDGLGAKDSLNALVSGNHPNAALQAQWNKATPQRQALMVLNQWGAYRTAAKGHLIKEDPQLRDQISQATQGRRALVAPHMGDIP